MKTHIFFLWAFLFIYCLCASASVEVRSTHMTTGDGIANNSIRYIFQDSKGFIWMGTLNGLSRYDGNSFMTFRPEGGDKISLADHRIKDLEEDGNGFLWISTSPELYSCYDLKKDCFVDFTGCGEYRQYYGRKMTARNGDIWLWHEGNGCRKIVYKDNVFTSEVFKKEKGNLPSDKVTYIYEDEQDIIWIGTREGVTQLVGDKAVLTESNHDAFAAMSYGKQTFFLSSDGKISLKEEGAPSRILVRLGSGKGLQVYGSIRLQDDWVIFTSEGGFIFHLKTWDVSRRDELDIKNGEVQADNHGNFWVYNHTGKVWYVNAQTRAVKTFQLIPNDKVSYIDQERYHIVHDSRDIIWISTYGNGLFAYDLNTDELQHFTSNINGFSHITSNFLQYVMEDRAGGIWVSSEYTGLSHLSVLNEGAERIFPEDESLSDRSNTVRMISKFKNNDICIGTRRGGVYTYDAGLHPKREKQYFHFNIYAVVEGADGSLWVGSRGDGLSIDGKWYRADDNTSIANNNIFTIYRDHKDRMWIGTFGGGLNLAVKGKDDYTFKYFLNKTYSQRQIRVIEEDGNGRIWVGTSEGVYVFHPDSLIADPENYLSYNYDNGKLRSNEIKCIYQDRKGRIWIGTSGAGFSMCTPDGDYKDLSFEHFDMSNGLVNNMVQSIVEDKEGKLWIATEYGISRFDTETHAFENFFFSAYALGNVYSESSACVSEDGRLLFGSNYGLVVITPEKIVNNATVNPVVALTNLHINGITMRPGDMDSPLNRALIYTDKIELKYFQNSIVIDFSTFDYSIANNGTKYTYRLDNYDKGWSSPSSLNFAAYKNLAPGTYVLRVKACNSAGIWGDRETVLVIQVTPPFWKTTWAFLLYTVLLIALLYMAYKLMRNFNTLRNRIQVEKQLTEYKLVFFTNISHEFRTPLTLIQGALEKIQHTGKVPKEMAYSLKIMDKSTRRMLRLINQLLEFRKMQNNKLALSLEETDVIAFLYEIFLSFNDAAESKNMDFAFVPSVASYKMFIDKGNLDKVTYNLLSNAFKYTPSGGKVTFSVVVDEAKKQLVISVADSGVGIPKEKREELFKRFMQSSFSGSSVGVGLHLTHELVNVHKGTIVYNENEGGGSVFTVSLPTDSGVYEDKDFLIPHNVLLEEEEEHHHQEAVTENDTDGEPLPSVPLNKRKVLIIEDDNDVREFLKEEVGQYFEVVAEADGPSGLERAKAYDADLIICDVLMPGMTGFEVTRKLKNDFDTSHIPIILLTAMSSVESHLEGVESGADAYITKPFSPKLLLARAFKLIEQREKLREKFSNDPNMVRPAICTSDRDKEFADKLHSIMEQQLSNAQFTVDEFASMMGLGRTVFYRKVRGVTGYSPNEYIRIIRMKKAAELLLENCFTVAEVSYKVGINDPFYFSKCFKQQFGVAPSVYLRGIEGGEPLTEK